MPLPAQTTHEIEGVNASTVDASDPCETDSGAEEAVTTPDAVTIELNFKAFADNVPPTEHARRTASYSDPTLQDFADQALEVAALRAELNRLNRDYGALQHAVRLRDMRLQAMREELTSARAQLRNATRQLSEAQPQSAPPTTEDSEAPMAHELSSTLDLTPTLDLSPARAGGSAAIPETPAPRRESQVPPPGSKRQLIPVDHDGDAVPLYRDIITIGRTRKNDVCIPSRAVSRDHARLLMSPRSVTVFDMDSANGCFVNDKPVKRQKLQDGDILRIGDRSYRFANGPDTAPA